MKNLKDLFEETLKDIYYAEHAILKALPKMAAKASTGELKKAFTSHLEETNGQVVRLDKVFEVLGKKPQSKKCDAIEGLIKEAEGIMEEAKTPEVMDAGLISSAQAVEHYEIARYGTLRTWAEELGMKAAVKLLQETLDQEHACNDSLTALAEDRINVAAEDGQHGTASGSNGHARKGTGKKPGMMAGETTASDTSKGRAASK